MAADRTETQACFYFHDEYVTDIIVDKSYEHEPRRGSNLCILLFDKRSVKC